ncbi:MAG: hypothetical protein ACM3O3_08070 [Syntrophothermus sp.]
MKKYFFVLLFIIFSTSSFSQYQFNGFDGQYPGVNQGQLSGGLGLNWIDGELFYSFNFRPEVSFLNFGVGLDLKLDFNKEGKLRKQNFDEFSDYLSIIRYVRYGMKRDPVFIKLGALDYYTLGHGSIMYQYNNSPSFDSRKTGLVFDLDFGRFGFESIYSKFAEAGVIGVRGYVRPLQFTALNMIPIISNIEVGASYATDLDPNAGITYSIYDTPNRKFINTIDKGAISIIGLDIGLPLLNTSMLNVQLYTDYAKIVDYGSGISTGIMLELNGLGILSAQAKLERRFNNGKYIPAYFNSFYEIERYRADSSITTLLTGIDYPNSVTSKIQRLESITKTDNGYYGELGLNFAGLFFVLGSYQRLDKTPESGIMHLIAEVAPEGVPFVARAGYDKVNIKNEKDLVTLDDRSYLFAELGYKPMPYILVSMVYNWTYTPLRDKDDNVIGFKPQKRIEPRVSFIYPFKW